MYQIAYTNRFKKDLKRCIKRCLEISKIEEVIDILQREGSLPQHYKPHKLQGNYSQCWECHIQANWLFNLATR